MKKAFSIILSIIFTICLLATMLLGVVRNNFSVSKITEMVSQIFKTAQAPVIQYEDNGLFYPEQKVITLAQFEGYDLGDFDLSSIDLTNMDVNSIVQSYLEANDIDVDPAVVTEILASPDITETVNQYADQIINYMTGASDEINIEPEQLTKVVNKAIDKYEEKTGEVIDRSGLDEAISTNVEAMVPELTATLDSAKEENAQVFEAIKIVNTILSLKVFIIALVVCFVLALIIFLINMNIFVCFKYISIPAIIDGLLLFIGAILAAGMVPSILKGLIADNGLPAAIYDLVIVYLNKVFLQLKICGIVATILGVILCVFGFMLGKKKPMPAKAEAETSSVENN